MFNDITIGDKCIVGGAAILKHSIPDCTVCKVPNDVIIEKQYAEDVIETKLMPNWNPKN